MLTKRTKIGDNIYSVGDKLVANEKAQYNKICVKGRVVTLVEIRDSTMFGVASALPILNWHNLEGLVPDKHGYWLSRERIVDSFAQLEPQRMIITEDVVHKNKSLKDMHCKMLKSVKNRGKEYSFVELDKDIGGGSADGLGKSGHCVIVPTNSLRPILKTITRSGNDTSEDDEMDMFEDMEE